jgi:galactarate dehydratase
MLDVPAAAPPPPRPAADAAPSAAPERLPATERAGFLGYRRADGRVGTRNFIAIVSSVNCSATVSRGVAAHFASPAGRLDRFPQVDGIVALTHGGGCAVNLHTAGYDYLTRVLAGYAAHPNVGAVLMIGLGCETNQIPLLLRKHGLSEGPLLRTLTIQASGGTRATIAAGIEAIEAMLPEVDAARRTPQSAGHLTLALAAEAADDPAAEAALGHAVDLLLRQGGTAVLAQTPDLLDAAPALAGRAASPTVAERLAARIEDWRSAATRPDPPEQEPRADLQTSTPATSDRARPSALARAGASRLEAVYDYGEPIAARGLVLMDTPRYAPVALTGQIAGGCTLAVLATGRGGASSCKPVPMLRLATSTPLFERMSEDLDLDGGTVASGLETVEQAGTRIFQALLAAASGEPTRSELGDFGDNGFAPWQVGAVM